MPLSPRVTVPVSAAVLCVAVIGGYFFWQLENTRAELTAAQPDTSGSGTTTIQAPTDTTASLNDTGDVSLLHLRRGDVFALEGQWKDAEDEYQQAVKAGGGLPALRKLAQAQLERRDFRNATNTLDQLRRAGEKPEDQLLLESLIDLHSGELDKARTLLSAASDSPQKQYGLALLAIITNDNDTAKTELAQVQSGWEPVLRSYAQTLLGAYSEYALFPQSPAIHLQTLIAHALAQVQECELALPIVSQVTRTQDDYRDAWIVQGFCELTTERYQDALASLERAYQLDPEKPETQYFLGRTYAALNDHGNALTFLQYALQNGFSPESEVRQWIATEAVANNQVDVALDQYDALTKLPDATIDTYTQYVTTALAAGKKQEAAVKAQEATQKFPDEAQSWDLLGWAEGVNGNKDQARQNLQKALQMDPSLQSAKDHLKGL
ncbi:MAG TPA: tetratricopeptide repeat protein [Candidatus Peribacteraceae bacterium]|nr:tetratricopeptide repeat protein [Candidatus Peribacteraceae bacterium]